MSPRRHHRRDEIVAFDQARARLGVRTTVAWRDGEWMVRAIPGGAAAKTYRCPGCEQEIRPGVAHVVAWPVGPGEAGIATRGGGMGLGGSLWGGDGSDRRHWHSGCWRARDRRGPTSR